MENSAVQSIDRAICILETLSSRPSGMGLVELSVAVNLHKSTVHRLLASLSASGYVVQDSTSARYKLSLRMFEVGSRVVAGMDVISSAKPHLDALSRQLGEAVHLVIPSGADIVYVYKVDAGNNAMRMSSRAGLRIPMYCTGVGKAILSTLPSDDVAALWAQSEVKPLTSKTITDFKAFQKQLDSARAEGFAIDDEENEAGIRCVALPLAGVYGKAIAAFSVSAPVNRMPPERVSEIARISKVCQTAILRDLGLSSALI